MDRQLTWRVASDWSELFRIRNQIGELLREYPRELRSATAMAGSELLENAIKYGRNGPGVPPIEFSLQVAPNCLRVAVVSYASDAAVVTRLVQRVSELSKVADLASYCNERLEESVLPPLRRGDRGLYRIGGEGGFELECTVLDDVVTVVATRRIQ